ncbi:hypothetical protein AALO_G00266680 [Alosa alosa]|uniref:Uncharacterized protein n=1 Tax=Alosa alosa TaxID=278164 RepID=A0AAV6FL48_9TELE|nr:hypothetical protein AALO_G00266680 [Alosa alosa]
MQSHHFLALHCHQSPRNDGCYITISLWKMGTKFHTRDPLGRGRDVRPAGRGGQVEGHVRGALQQTHANPGGGRCQRIPETPVRTPWRTDVQLSFFFFFGVPVSNFFSFCLGGTPNAEAAVGG